VTEPTDADADPDPDLWLILIRPMPSNLPAAVRVRQLLKRALRDWGLKCIEVRTPTPAEAIVAADGFAPGDRPPAMTL